MLLAESIGILVEMMDDDEILVRRATTKTLASLGNMKKGKQEVKQ